MVKKLLFLILLSPIFSSYAQSDRTQLFGFVKSDAKAAQDIHVYNKSAGFGTITNSNGQFKILVKEKDTLTFSGIQFYFKEFIVSDLHIKNKTIIIDLLLRINELDEVEVRAHDLSGSLITDTNKVKDTVSNFASTALDFSMIDFSKIVIEDIDAVSREKAPNAASLTNPNMPIGGNILGLLKFALDPLMDEMSKIGRKRRKRKKDEFIYKAKVLSISDTLISDLGITFFTETLLIPKEKIDDFIDHCRPLGVADLYINGSKIEAIDLLLKESKNFKK